MHQMEFVERLLERAREAGLAMCEVYCASGSSFEVSIFQGEIVHYSSADSAGLTLRALVNDKMGYASTQALDEEAIDLLIDAVRENAELIESEDRQFLFGGGSEYAEISNYNAQLDALDVSKKIALAREMEKRALEADPRIQQVGDCVLITQSSEIAIANTQGLHLSHRCNLIGGYLSPVAKEGDKVNTGFAMFYTSDPNQIDLTACVQRAVREAVDGLNAQSIPSGEYRVLLSGLCMADLLSTFSGVFSAEQAQKGLSLFKDREGAKVAAECVTLVDDPHLPASPSSTPFDDEGVPTFRKNVLDRGVLTTLLHNLKTAHKAGVKTTANASKAGYSAPVDVAPSNFLLVPGQRSLSQMLEALGEGIYITDLQGHHSGANPVSGDFSLSAKGYLVRAGKIAQAVQQITVAGNFFELLEKIEALGSDLQSSFPGSSTFFSPSVLIQNLSVAGL
ncbi:MAG TPA: TldD/PmbA family protein [Candidatus Pullichristensenella excrementigallinarum]|uniref:TldD/PmbA family protein n=1 Tax=Candidatus Pullichristensenella excrementigallinarum TaxID=2840907 RepID=A0A9D1IA43_9FIRM|nr:TldD/PmbA family protein [Candidatus Pullichristensenella excrementigallinarum]